MNVFALARMRRPALVAEYLRWCSPPPETAIFAPPMALRGLRSMPNGSAQRPMSREALVKAILDAAERGATRI